MILCRLQTLITTIFVARTLNFNGVTAAPTQPQPAPNRPVVNIADAMKFLNHYGYAHVSPDAPMTDDVVEKPVREFQHYTHLNETGKLDNETTKKMNEPRCGVKDFEGEADESGRRKRFFAPVRWYKTDLTYKISMYTSDLPEWLIDREIAAAFKLWSDVTPLTFTKVDRYAFADINVKFVPSRTPHNDGYFWGIFDGPGRVLAHAFYPTFYGEIAGDAHFDDGESWTANSYYGTNLYLVAAHEFGHSLGLGHSNVYGALMYAYHSGYRQNYQLHPDDIAGIQYLYGQKPEATEPPVVAIPNPNPNPNQCPTRMDTITETSDGSTYAFQGALYWRLTDGRVDYGYPKSVPGDWQGLVGGFDASFTASNYWFWRPSGLHGKTWFFKGGLVWRFKDRVMDSGYPKPIFLEFPGLPNDIDAAFEYSGNGQTYFFKDNYFYMLNWQMEVVGPFYMSNWRGIPSTVDAVLQASDEYVYFLKDNQYYKFSHSSFSTLPGYPRSFGTDWLQCNSALVAPDHSEQQPGDDIGGVGGLALHDGNDESLATGQSGAGRVLASSIFLLILAPMIPL
ncbi:stromelysin-3-like [Ptychodera flava]|uniref:stromelysin-3-like n=1 Tax=Ptychodera flava TaxID=63121 RepID=UPI00396A173B